MVAYSSLNDLAKEVASHGGLLTVPAGDLCKAHGAERLGKHVRAGISKELAGLGLAHYPVPLPASQEQLVRVYRLGSPTADLVDAVLNPSEEHDEEVREAVNQEAARVLQQIRELVCK